MEQELKQVKKFEKPKQYTESIVRILLTDIPGNSKVYIGLTRIKGISFAISNALCKILKIDKNKKISELTKEEIDKIIEEIKNPRVPVFLINRRNDIETGANKHLITTGLNLQKEFDIKRLKKIRVYKGLRHTLGLPVRGQRTKSHFRKKGKSRVVGVKKTK